MTEGLKPAPLSTTPEAVAAVVVDAVAHPQGAGVGARAAAVRDERAAARPDADLPPPADLTGALPGGHGLVVGHGGGAAHPRFNVGGVQTSCTPSGSATVTRKEKVNAAPSTMVTYSSGETR